MNISLIIPTLNGGKQFVRLMEALSRQALVPDEVLIIDSGSTDDTLAVAGQSGARITSVRRQDFDHGGTRSMAAELASGEILIFMTQDAVPVDTLSVEKLVSALHLPGVAAAYGRQIPYPDATCFARHLRLFNYPPESCVRCWKDREEYGFKTVFISNSFAAYHRKFLAEVDFFENGLLFGEDTLTVARLLREGHCVAYAAEAQVFHSHNYSVFQDFRRYFDIGAFHADQKKFLADFGRPTGEGRRYVRSELDQLVREKDYWRLPESLLRSSMKYLAYNLGKRYSCLPRGLAILCSMNRGWWVKQGTL